MPGAHAVEAGRFGAVARLLGDCATGRAGGLSPYLVADLTTGGGTLRVVVLHTGGTAASLVPLLTGARPPRSGSDPVPCVYVHQPGGRPRLTLTDGHRRALDAEAWRLL
ncbi:MAG: hypothetical protein H5T76_12260, partial [Streptomyces sp.]|nr:hypothetical protein [Streptomyces sp.]